MPSTNVWASNAPDGTEEEITTPSGQTCRARKLSIESMVEAGMLIEADALTAQVQKYMRKVKGAKGKADGQELDTGMLLKDPTAFRALITMIDKVIPQIVISPPVALHYTEQTVGKTKVTTKISEGKRKEMREDKPDLVFTDQVGFEDKMFLFDWSAGGLVSMMQFRQ